MDLFHALSDEEGRLSSLEAKLAQFALENVDFVVNSSIVELAERVGVSPPTVTRFCRRLGCQGYSDFKVQLAKLAYVGLRYLKPEVPTTTVEEVAHDIVSKAQNALFELHRQLDLAAIEKAADILRGADFIQAFGGSGNSTMIVNELYNRLFRLGCRINASNDHGMNLMLSAAAQPGTVMFGSSFTGRDMGLVHCLELLRQNDIPTIVMTQAGSPVAVAADVVIAIEMPEGKNIFRPTSTRYAYLAAIDILANMVAYADRTKALRSLRSIKGELVRNRDGDDRQLLGD
ncbi:MULTISPECIES: MurR/RpiR family transcriptional regulator [Pseudorhizobium]|jgi:DNA-binding MurR/RpiR family transcriptional regulator|uniref:DNA-binding MurR/RpiR family transcriptional regulator n=2 Tax=Pseudorhizobium TaxID=1903858 RepID=A0A7X0DDV4_9HYPH|nr:MULTISPECIES: MurR/RpiR family transcriptional regulator [Pseudorhizobium]MBB6181262.1 DNA-binding MurR/RpiR family transcriptional regulator [Pseudorhizobium flavum]CAD6601461.1 MurR/RpiR family transcriptional regulator [Pseudorhizobium flavum]CAD7033001.1 MurR/RpiR family transcriptional regulator [Pseudorhizobium halotolerans]